MRAWWWARCAVSDGDVHVRADVVCLPCPNWPVATVSDGSWPQLALAGPGPVAGRCTRVQAPPGGEALANWRDRGAERSLSL